MKNLMIGAFAALLLLQGRPAQAEEFTVVATLGGGEEVPALLTGAVGTAVITVDTDTRELAVSLKVYNLPTGSTAGHIHVGPKGVAGPVVVDFPIPQNRVGDMNLNFTVGASQLRPNPGIGINTIDDVIQAIVGGGAYVNIHTAKNSAGEIRGQAKLTKTVLGQPAPAPPPPSSDPTPPPPPYDPY